MAKPPRKPDRRRAGPLLLFLIAAGGLALRLPHLSERPFHADESVHAVRCWDRWQHGTYRYDPTEYHGPTLYDATWPLLKLAGTATLAESQVSQYRAVPVLFGLLLILAGALLADGLGWPATLAAALLCAVSPANVFFSRDYIPEMLLVAFTALTLGSGWRWSRTGQTRWALATGLGAGLMLATKETALFCFAAAALGLAVAHPRRWRAPGATIAGAGGSPQDLPGRGRSTTGRGPTEGAPEAPGPLADAAASKRPARWRQAGGLVLVMGLTVGLLLSGGGRDWAGPVRLLASYGAWAGRVGGGDHDPQPWFAYLAWLIDFPQRGGPPWSEALILGLGLVGLAGAPGADRRLVRFLGGYTLALTALYSAMPYKLPWLLLGFLHGFTLLAGCGAARLVARPRRPLGRALLLFAFLAGAGHLAWQSQRLLFDYTAIDRNPYSYSETAWDMLDLDELVPRLVAAAPAPGALVVQVLAADRWYWPLPWYLRAAPRVGYWVGTETPLPGQIILAAAAFHDTLAARLGPRYEPVGHFGLRRRVVYELWVEQDLWARTLATPAGR